MSSGSFEDFILNLLRHLLRLSGCPLFSVLIACPVDPMSQFLASILLFCVGHKNLRNPNVLSLNAN